MVKREMRFFFFLKNPGGEKVGGGEFTITAKKEKGKRKRKLERGERKEKE